MAEKDQRSVPAPLTPRQRIVSGAIGAALTAVGGTAVFLAENDAAIVALLGVGGLFLVMATTGYALTRIKFGDYEVAFPEQVREAQEAIARGDEEAADRIGAEIVRSSQLATLPTAEAFWQQMVGTRPPPSWQRATSRAASHDAVKSRT